MRFFLSARTEPIRSLAASLSISVRREISSILIFDISSLPSILSLSSAYFLDNSFIALLFLFYSFKYAALICASVGACLPCS
uniref:Uncharacterized protein n=1 Tax=Podoviridae sp. ctG4L18 TaxID=2825234 RepID=A0A8S5UNX2_9CAUD|nr:MAG TPA: hypothetical protein [Podoviridae sp. ctG4L18]